MRRTLPLAVAALLPVVAALSACAYNPDLGRDQISLVNDASLEQAGEQAWNQALQQSKVSSDRAANARVRAVGQRVVDAAGWAVGRGTTRCSKARRRTPSSCPGAMWA